MNRNQARLAWLGVILLSLLAIMVGYVMLNDASSHDRTSESIFGLLIAAGIPIVLIFGFAYIRAGQKEKTGKGRKKAG